MTRIITAALFIYAIYNPTFGRDVTANIDLAHVPNSSLITVNVVVSASSNHSDTHIKLVGGYDLKCPVNPAEEYPHLKSASAIAQDGNVLEFGLLPLGHRTDSSTYKDGYPMTRAWEQVRSSGKPMQCQLKLKSTAVFAKDQISISLTGGGFSYGMNLVGAEEVKEEIKSDIVTLRPPVGTGPIDPCIAYCAEFDPLLIDLNQDGIHLGVAGRGVWFDMLMTGVPQYMQWVAVNGDEAFLAYDLNGNGVVDNGSELFGNGTFMRTLSKLKQGKALEDALKKAGEFATNGFVALGQFDTPALGGNDDGVITSDDSVWPKLSLWLDSNADGISTVDEMLSLHEADITQLSVIPRQSQRIDSAGNWIPLWAWSYNSQLTGNRKHKMVDVFFKGL